MFLWQLKGKHIFVSVHYWRFFQEESDICREKIRETKKLKTSHNPIQCHFFTSSVAKLLCGFFVQLSNPGEQKLLHCICIVSCLNQTGTRQKGVWLILEIYYNVLLLPTLHISKTNIVPAVWPWLCCGDIENIYFLVKFADMRRTYYLVSFVPICTVTWNLL